MDDEVQERRRIGDFLLQKGYDILAVGNAQDAMEAIKRERFDVFLTDCNIPGVDALQTSDEAHKINPDMAVIIMTAFGTIETAVKAGHNKRVPQCPMIPVAVSGSPLSVLHVIVSNPSFHSVRRNQYSTLIQCSS